MKKILAGLCFVLPTFLMGQTVIISENFDTLTAGNYVGLESPYFTTWANVPGTPEDAFISDSIFSSDSNSVHVEGICPGGLTDLLIPFPTNYTSGTLEFSMKYYVEPGKGAYFNLQQDTTPAVGWMMEVYFNSNGTGDIYAGSPSPVPFTYSPGTWTDILVNVNLDADAAKLSIGGVLVHAYQFSSGSSGAGLVKSWGGVNLYAAGGTQSICVTPGYFADDILLEIPSTCPTPIASYMTMVNGLDVTFTNLSGTFGTTQYLWDFDDGSSSTVANPTHTYATLGNYNVCLTVIDTCGMDSTCQNIIVIDSSGCPLPTAGFTYTTSGLSITFVDASSVSGPDSIVWNMGDGTIIANDTIVNYFYAGSGTYNVCLVVYDSCGVDTICQVVTIVAPCPSPTAGFSYSDSDLTVIFSDTSWISFSATYYWDFGDGVGTSTVQNPSYTYGGSGPYNVCLVVSDSCGVDTICQVVTVVASCPSPTAGFTYFANNLSALFTASCTFSGSIMYSWVFGDGNSSNLESPNNTYSASGTYTVCLTIIDSCGTDSICQDVTVADSSVGISGVDNPVVAVYPNPAIDQLYFKSSFKDQASIFVYNSLGRLIQEMEIDKPEMVLNVEYYSEGVYFYRVLDRKSEHVVNGRFVVSR